MKSGTGEAALGKPGMAVTTVVEKRVRALYGPKIELPADSIGVLAMRNLTGGFRDAGPIGRKLCRAGWSSRFQSCCSGDLGSLERFIGILMKNMRCIPLGSRR